MSDILKRISIEKPCSADWEQMTGNEQVRFCRHCDLSVQDLSQMTRAKARKLVRRSKGRLCLRIHRTPAGEVITRPVSPKLYNISRRASRIAAGTFTAVISLSTAAYAQSSASGPVNERPRMGRVAVRPVPPVCDLPQNPDEGDPRVMQGDVAVSVAYKVPLVQAASNQDLKAIEAILRSGANVNAAEEDGTTALSLAVSNDNYRIVRRLLQAGADPNVLDGEGGNTLFLVDDDTDLRLVRLLLKHGANVNQTNEDGDTPLTNAAEWDDGELIQVLIEGGANVNLQNNEGNTALMIAVTGSNVEDVEVLLEAGADVNLRNADDEDALVLADDNGYEEISEMLIKAGAVRRDPEENDGTGESDETDED